MDFFNRGQPCFFSMPHPPGRCRAEIRAGRGGLLHRGMCRDSLQGLAGPVRFRYHAGFRGQLLPGQEEAGFLEITVRLERKSGEADAWMRINRAFLHDLRKELLVWRSLDESAKKQYDRLIELKQEELKGSDRR